MLIAKNSNKNTKVFDTHNRFSNIICSKLVGVEFGCEVRKFLLPDNSGPLDTIYFKIIHRNLTRWLQNLKMCNFNRLGEIGGLMGLLMGASVLSICEVFDLVVYNSFRKVHNRHSRTHPSTTKQAW